MKNRPPNITKHDKKKAGLFWRIFGFGLFLLLAIGATVIAVFATTGFDGDMHGVPRRASRVISERLSEHLAKKNDVLEQLLEDTAKIWGHSLAIFEEDGRALARAGRRRLEALDKDQLARMERRAFFSRDGRHLFAIWLERPSGEKRAYLVSSADAKTGPPKGLLILAIVLAMLAATSYPAARMLSRPLERLTRTANEFARGNLAVRTEVRGYEEVRVLARAFNDMAQALTQRIRREKELLGNVSHELRTPLSRIGVALQICEETDDAAAIKKKLDGIGQDLYELEEIVEDVLALTRLDSDAFEKTGFPLRPEPSLLGELVHESVERIQTAQPSRIFHIKEDIKDIPIEVDRRLIRRLLGNLLQNAVQYSEHDTEVEIAVTAKDGNASVEVLDRGIGVPEDDLPRLFEPFFRSERSRDKRAGGVGLGLALSKRIAAAHDGQITAQSRPGGGMIFRFTVPKSPRPHP